MMPLLFLCIFFALTALLSAYRGDTSDFIFCAVVAIWCFFMAVIIAIKRDKRAR